MSTTLRLVLRRLRRSPAFVASAVCVLSGGLALGSVGLAIVDAALLKTDSRWDHLVRFRASDWAEDLELRLSPGDVARLRSHPPESLRTVVGYGLAPLSSVRVGEQTFAASIEGVFGPYFEMFGARPIQGRLLTSADDSMFAAVAVISERFWRARLGADPSVIGRTAAVSGRLVTIVGVVQGPFAGNGTIAATDLWAPSWLVSVHNVYGELRPDISLAAASAEVSGRYAETAPDGMRRTLELRRGKAPKVLPRQAAVAIGAALVIGACCLLLVGSSVSLMVLARFSTSQSELRTRLALGASPARAAIPWILEWAIIVALAVVVGGALTLVLTRVAVGYLVSEAGIGSAAFHISPSWKLVIYSAVAACGLVVAVAHALTRRVALLGELVDRSGSQGGALGYHHSSLLVGQVAVATFLLLVAGLALKTGHSGRSFDPGFTPDSIGVGRLDESNPDRAFLAQNRALVLATVRGDPRIREAALATRLFGLFSTTATTDGHQASASISPVGITTGFFDVLGVRLVRGNEPVGTPDAASAILSERASRDLFGAAEAIGRFVHVATGGPQQVAFQVTGIAPDLQYPDGRQRRVIYLPYEVAKGLWPAEPAILLASGSGDGRQVATALARAVADRLPHASFARIGTARDELAALTGPADAFGTMLASVGFFGLLLTAAAFYGLGAQIAQQRRLELGVRLALGASPLGLGAMFAAETRTAVLRGVSAGAIVAVVASAMWRARSLSYLTLYDGVTVVGVISVVSLLAFSGALLPYIRLLLVSPSVLLRAK